MKTIIGGRALLALATGYPASMRRALNRNAEEVPSPPDAITRVPRRGVAMALGGLLLPAAAFFAVGMLVRPPPGIDGYVPAFLGALVGAVVGVVLMLVGMVSLVKGRSQRRTTDNG